MGSYHKNLYIHKEIQDIYLTAPQLLENNTAEHLIVFPRFNLG